MKKHDRDHSATDKYPGKLSVTMWTARLPGLRRQNQYLADTPIFDPSATKSA
jgi:hypothetical protein